MRIREVTGKEMGVLFPVSVLKWEIYADLACLDDVTGKEKAVLFPVSV